MENQDHCVQVTITLSPVIWVWTRARMNFVEQTFNNDDVRSKASSVSVLATENTTRLLTW